MFLAGRRRPLVATLPSLSLAILGCVQNVITGHSPVVDDFPVSTETEHKAEKVFSSRCIGSIRVLTLLSV